MHPASPSVDLQAAWGRGGGQNSPPHSRRTPPVWPGPSDPHSPHMPLWKRSLQEAVFVLAASLSASGRGARPITSGRDPAAGPGQGRGLRVHMRGSVCVRVIAHGEAWEEAVE